MDLFVATVSESLQQNLFASKFQVTDLPWRLALKQAEFSENIQIKRYRVSIVVNNDFEEKEKLNAIRCLI